MPFGSNKAACSCDAEIPSFASIEEDVSKNVSVVANFQESVEEQEALPSGPLGGQRHSLYNLIKGLAKLDDVDAAAQKLAKAAAMGGVDLDVKNGKGSTALHACAYVKRWDLARILLSHGANPMVKNAAGNTFFLCAVKEPEAPWRDLFSNRPELIEKHQRYLERGKGRSEGSRARSARAPADERESPISGDPTSQSDSASGRASDVRAKVAALLTSGRQLRLEDLQSIGAGLASVDADAFNQVVNMLAPGDWVEALRTLTLQPGQAAELTRRLSRNDDPEVFSNWMGLSPKLCDLDLGDDILRRLLRQGRVDDVKAAVKQGIFASEDFIEDCEERGLYDLADHLINFNSERSVSVSKAAPPVKKGARGAHPRAENKGAAAPAKAKGAAPGKPKPSRKPSKVGRPSNRAAKIANLDGPLREANDFEYRERAVPTKATIVIVKKARPILMDHGPATD